MALQEKQPLLRGTAPLFEWRSGVLINENEEPEFKAAHEEKPIVEEDGGDEYPTNNEENDDNHDIAGSEPNMEILEEGNLEPATVYNDEVADVPNPIIDEVLDGRKDTLVTPPQIMDAERGHRVFPTHDTVHEIIRHEKLRSASPPVSEGVRSAHGSPILRRSRRIRNPPNSHRNTYKDKF